jgi:hypothetical protein
VEKENEKRIINSINKQYFSQLYTLLYQQLYIINGWTLMC